MLLDDLLPEFDVRTSYATRIAASPARAYGNLKTADFDHWGLTRALYAFRALATFPAVPRETWPASVRNSGSTALRSTTCWRADSA